MAQVVGGIGTSHVPAIGAAIDRSLTEDEYFRPLFVGYEPMRAWVRELQPDVAIVVYNDHASAFPFQVMPTFALGVAAAYEPADEGFGPRDVPSLVGDPELAWHLAESLILDHFDLTIVSDMPVDHGLTVPLSIVFDTTERWPCRVIPLAVNVIQYPPPTPTRCYDLGVALRAAIESYPHDTRVLVIGTGGLSHQLGGERAGWLNPDFDRWFLDRFSTKPSDLLELTHADYVREAGSEGLEMIMWLVMRGALGAAREVHRHYHYPVSNTAVGLIALAGEPNPLAAVTTSAP